MKQNLLEKLQNKKPIANELKQKDSNEQKDTLQKKKKFYNNVEQKEKEKLNDYHENFRDILSGVEKVDSNNDRHAMKTKKQENQTVVHKQENCIKAHTRQKECLQKG